MILVIPTKTRTNVMYARAAETPPSEENVVTDWPPPRIPARRRPCNSRVMKISGEEVDITYIRKDPCQEHLE